MEPRSLYTSNAGSSATALASRTIRHRGLSPKIPQEPESRAPTLFRPAESITPSTSKGEADGVNLQLRIIPEQSHAPSPLLPFSQLGTKQLPEIPESTSSSENVLDAAPLTPRPEVQDKTKSNPTDMSRLPSPDFSAVPRTENSSFGNVLDSFKGLGTGLRPKSTREGSAAPDPRRSRSERHIAGLQGASASSADFLHSVRMPSENRLKSRVAIPSEFSSDITNRPQQTRTSTSNSSQSSSSARTSISTTSIDSGRAYLFPGIGTTDRFTHRWPKPANLKKLERQYSTKIGDDFKAVTVEELSSGSYDVGLGFERVGRWTTHKWYLLLSVLSVLGYSIAVLVYSILAWYQTWDHADVMLVADGDILILATLCASLLLLAALAGLTGTLLNSRPLLAVYSLLLWPAYISLLSIGYISFKRASFSLDRKLNLAWSQWYTDAGRAVIQDSLRCCGFADPTHEAFYGPGVAGGCYPRSPRPGCKGPLLHFERENLGSLWRAAFSTVPLHMLSIIISLLCANHVTRPFGTGLIPRGYRLRVSDVRADARKLLEHFTTSGRDGVVGLPPAMARTESGTVWRRDDKVYAYGHTTEFFRSGNSTLRRVSRNS